jgi:hypothetical protein
MQQSLAGHRCQPVDSLLLPGTRTNEGQVPNYSRKPPNEPGKVRYRSPLPFAGEG